MTAIDRFVAPLRRRPALGATLLLAVLATLPLAPALFDSDAVLYSPFSDFLAQHLSSTRLLYESWNQLGSIPLWNPFLNGGAPALADPQAAYTNPLSVFFWLLAPERALAWTAWLHVWLAGVAMLIWLRVLRLRWLAAVGGAIAYQFSFKLFAVIYAGWSPHWGGLVVAPLLWATAVALDRSPGISRVLALIGALVLALHQANQQVLVYHGIFIGAFLLWGIGTRLWRGERAAALHRVVATATAAVLATGLCAYLLAGQIELVSLSTRSPGGTSGEFFRGVGMLPRHALTALDPFAAGWPLTKGGKEAWETVAYPGLSSLVLALCALGLRPGRRERALWAGAAVAFGVAALASNVDVGLQYLPGIGLFRIPLRMLFVFVLFIVTLSAWALDRLADPDTEPLGLAGWIPALLAGAGGVLVALISDHAVTLGVAIGGLSAIAIMLFARPVSPGRRTAAAALLVVIIAGEGALLAGRLVEVAPAQAVLAQPSALRIIGPRQGAPSLGAGRILSLGYSIPFGYAAQWGLPNTGGFNSLGMAHWLRFSRAVQGLPPAVGPRVWNVFSKLPRGDALRALGVSHVVADRDLSAPFLELASQAKSPVFTFYRGFTERRLRVYRVKAPLGRAFFVRGTVSAPSWDKAIAISRWARLDNTAILERPPIATPALLGRPPRRRVVVEQYRPGMLRLHVEPGVDRVLVVSESWHPGWRASIDGRPAPLLRANGAMLALEVGQEARVVDVRFSPDSLRIGAWLSSATAALVILLGLGGWWWRRRRSVSEAQRPRPIRGGSD